MFQVLGSRGLGRGSMDGSRLSLLPHHSWFGFSFEMPPATKAAHQSRETNHTLVMVTRGAVDVQWIRRGCERLYHHGLEQVAFFASDNESHIRTIRSAATPSSAYLLTMPPRHLIGLAESDGVCAPSDYAHFMPREDLVLRECLMRLASTTGCGVSNEIGAEIMARRLVLRLVELLGGQAPDWHEDLSVFSHPVMKRILEHIDSRLQDIGLEELASLYGLSPSHFARKVRHTEGLSLCRFINRRRLVKALVVLRDDATPVSRVALDLGFSSQSHFTRLFSDLTGMTPAKYRKQFRRSVG